MHNWQFTTALKDGALSLGYGSISKLVIPKNCNTISIKPFRASKPGQRQWLWDRREDETSHQVGAWFAKGQGGTTGVIERFLWLKKI
jgi:hypothetical protein